MVTYDEEIKFLAMGIRKSMQESKSAIKEKKSEEANIIKERQKLFRICAPIMTRVMKPLAKALMQKNRKISDINKRIKFSPPTKTYQECEIYIPFGLSFNISIDFETDQFLLKIIKYKNSKDIELELSKECSIIELNLKDAANDLFMKYVKENLI